jgi:hypothetical protein
MLEKGVYVVMVTPKLKEASAMGPCHLIHKKGMITCAPFPEYRHI